MKILKEKIIEAAFSVLPVALIVVILFATPLVDLSATELAVFLVSSVLLIAGIALFSLGADLAMSPMGEHVGAGLTRARRPLLLVAVCFLMGVLITIAEPDLSVLAKQIEDMVSSGLLLAAVGGGVGIFLVLSVLRTVTGKTLPPLLMFFYLVIFAMTAFLFLRSDGAFATVAFDSGGVTTGPITVPFIMSLGIGIAATAGRTSGAEGSFGSIALCSVGPVLAVVLIGFFSGGEVTYTLPDYSVGSHLGSGLLPTILDTCLEVAVSLLLIAGFFLILQFTVLKLPAAKLKKIGMGVLYTYAGLVIFMNAVKIGFMPIGFKLGTELASNVPPALLSVFGLVTGTATVLAEPAIRVLTRQVERVTDGNVSRRSMMIALCVGVGVSVGLSLLRIVLDFSILYYLIPGYILSLGLSLLVPGVYTAIAFDSGGVASGPMTSSFILPFAIGACAVLQGTGKIPTDAFGVVAMVAMTPLITIQLLGFRSVVTRRIRARRAMARILSSEDEQIIEFTF